MLRGEFAAQQHHRRDGSLLRFLSPTECPSRAAAISKRNNWAEQYCHGGDFSGFSAV
jgi:hypothetical protein